MKRETFEKIIEETVDIILESVMVALVLLGIVVLVVGLGGIV